MYSGSGCQTCGGGFISRSGWCTSCADTTGWTDRNGLTCAQISTSQCNDVKVKGLSSNEACCKCHWVQRDEILHSSHEFVHPVILLSSCCPVWFPNGQMAVYRFRFKHPNKFKITRKMHLFVLRRESSKAESCVHAMKYLSPVRSASFAHHHVHTRQ